MHLALNRKQSSFYYLILTNIYSSVYRSNPTSPTQQAQQYQPPPVVQQRTANTYHPALRGGVAVFPPGPVSPQVRRKVQSQQAAAGPGGNTPTAPGPARRPMSFIRALEMTDGVEMSNQQAQQQQQQQQQYQQGRSDTPDRTSVYDMNYEISV